MRVKIESWRVTDSKGNLIGEMHYGQHSDQKKGEILTTHFQVFKTSNDLGMTHIYFKE